MVERELSGRGYNRGREAFDDCRSVTGFVALACDTEHAEAAWRAGWWSRWLEVFEDGADSADLPAVIDNPYGQFSPAWEAWAAGFEARHAREA
ncbi:hypothetical protein CPT_Sansa111 [Caulobacter phage Sansa]|uniref:Uncharacterized protein n=1 Tax=Caulobacter phage Sansa TaxID=1675600 RepID=A0A0K1LN07_9CAUD|nr:hypothetical protein HOR07_gp111 [Caulobacter phage Sansa]AKU43515.1 hypothetical protein CPT_Sansa111 [Caulobacter phage Sansa]